MNAHVPVPASNYGELIEPATLKIQRVLPGSAERVWDYLTKSELRRKWLASGDIEMKAGSPFELTWHNDELTEPPGHRPEGFGAEHTMQSQVVECDPPRKLMFTWGNGGDVTFTLEPRSGDRVLLTVIHRRLGDRSMMVKVGAGWHSHLDILVARVSGTEPTPFWDHWSSLRDDYDQRLPK